MIQSVYRIRMDLIRIQTVAESGPGYILRFGMKIVLQIYRWNIILIKKRLLKPLQRTRSGIRVPNPPNWIRIQSGSETLATIVPTNLAPLKVRTFSLKVLFPHVHIVFRSELCHFKSVEDEKWGTLLSARCITNIRYFSTFQSSNRSRVFSVFILHQTILLLN